MKNGQCPKCNSETVYSQAGGIFFYNIDLHVRTGSLDRAVPFVSYICTTCGYFENFGTNQGKLAVVARTWQKVPANPQ
jgi:hypothetical protein